MGRLDEYKLIAERLCYLSNAYAKANWWRRMTIAKDIADETWRNMPMIYSAMVHHTAGMKAQRSPQESASE